MSFPSMGAADLGAEALRKFGSGFHGGVEWS